MILRLFGFLSALSKGFDANVSATVVATKQLAAMGGGEPFVAASTFAWRTGQDAKTMQGQHFFQRDPHQHQRVFCHVVDYSVTLVAV